MKTNKEDLSTQFLELKERYQRLGLNVQQALETFLKEYDIPYLSINYRVKELDSFLEKIERQGYTKPFDEVEDICGIRIICYYQSDIHRIQKIIEQEFWVQENQNKQEQLEPNEFGYRSIHFIAKVKSDWTNAPNYRHLDELKFEVQLRTILMHSWAEIEHKLSYKSETHIPKRLRRKFSMISAKLEEADGQFEEIRDSINFIKSELISKAKEKKQFDYSTELNLDSLQAFLDFVFPNRIKNIKQTSSLLTEMEQYSISFRELIEGFEKYKEDLPKIEKEQMKEFGHQDEVLWAQTGAARTLFHLINDQYLKDGKDSPIYEIMVKWKGKLKSDDV